MVALSKNRFISSFNSLIFSKNIVLFSSSSSAFFPNNIKGSPGRVRELIIGSITVPIFSSSVRFSNSCIRGKKSG